MTFHILDSESDSSQIYLIMAILLRRGASNIASAGYDHSLALLVSSTL